MSHPAEVPEQYRDYTKVRYQPVRTTVAPPFLLVLLRFMRGSWLRLNPITSLQSIPRPVTLWDRSVVRAPQMVVIWVNVTICQPCICHHITHIQVRIDCCSLTFSVDQGLYSKPIKAQDIQNPMSCWLTRLCPQKEINRSISHFFIATSFDWKSDISWSLCVRDVTWRRKALPCSHQFTLNNSTLSNNPTELKNLIAYARPEPSRKQNTSKRYSGMQRQR